MPEPRNLTQKLIASHLVRGSLVPGTEIGLHIDQTLTQDATGTLVMLELEAMGLDRVRTEVSVQYVDHNLLQTDNKNPDDHVFLKSAAERFGLWFSRPGNGVSHPVHMERFGIPGKSLAGSDSHTPAAGALGMLALGAGGLDVAFAMAGEPLFLRMPKIVGIELTGSLPDWVSAKDIVLELLRRHGVMGCKGKILEYHGDALEGLSAMDRHVIANMGTEMGATTSVFPSDQETRCFLASQGRMGDWKELSADEGATYDEREELELSALEPLIALPGSPGKVVKVREVAGRPVHQAYLGSSANPGLRDFWVPAEMVKGRIVHPEVSFDVNPSTRQVLEHLMATGALQQLVRAGARLHETGCNGCIGMGQAPATGRNSLRTVPRNFPGRSGTEEDSVYLCSPETATAAALTGEITDPRDLESLLHLAYPRFEELGARFSGLTLRNAEPSLLPVSAPPAHGGTVTSPLPRARGETPPALVKGPNIQALPDLPPLADAFRLPALLKLGDNISTDDILRAGAEALPLRSNIPAISRFAYSRLDAGFHSKALQAKKTHGGHLVVAGENYAQGSSREHAALAPRFLGQVAVLAKSYARLGWQNLINFGILPLEFIEKGDYNQVEEGDILSAFGLRELLASWAEGTGPREFILRNETRGKDLAVTHGLSPRQAKVILAGGIIGYFKLTSLAPPGEALSLGGLEEEHAQAKAGGVETINRVEDDL